MCLWRLLLVEELGGREYVENVVSPDEGVPVGGLELTADVLLSLLQVHVHVPVVSKFRDFFWVPFGTYLKYQRCVQFRVESTLAHSTQFNFELTFALIFECATL